MAQLIIDGDPGAAADKALENSHFYNTVFKNYVTPWTDEDQTHDSSLISMYASLLPPIGFVGYTRE
jgi:hypothetical protein